MGGRVLEESLRARAPRGRLAVYGATSRHANGAAHRAAQRASLRDLPFADAPSAHEDLRARRMMAELLLDPSA